MLLAQSAARRSIKIHSLFDQCERALRLLVGGLALLATTQGAAVAQTVDYALISKGRVGDTAPSVISGAALSSSDGRFTVFSSDAPNIVAGQQDRERSEDVFLYDRIAGTVSLVSHAFGSGAEVADSDSTAAAISADGNRILFHSFAQNLVPGVTYGARHLHAYLYDRATGTSTLVSRALGSATTAPNGWSEGMGLSADGGIVLYQSRANNLIAGVADANGEETDIYLFNVDSGATTLVSRAGVSASTSSVHGSTAVAISANGMRVLFASRASDLVAGATDGNDEFDTFLFDRSTASTLLVSHANGLAAVAANGHSYPTAISADGNRVLFGSYASNLVAGVTDTGGLTDSFLFDRASGTVTLVSRALNSATTVPDAFSQPHALSADGNRVVFSTAASNIVPGVTDGNFTSDVFVFDRSSGTAALVSSAAGSAGMVAANAGSFSAVMSADGDWIAFETNATNLLAGVSDANGGSDIYLHHRASATVQMVSHAPALPSTSVNNSSSLRAISGDGSAVAFRSYADNVVAGTSDFNHVRDLFLFDRAPAVNALLTRAAFPVTPTLLGSSSAVDMSDDGQIVLYESNAIEAATRSAQKGEPLERDVYLHDRGTGQTVLVSHAAGSANTPANERSEAVALSSDGRFVLFQSFATDLIAGLIDANSTDMDVFVFDRISGETLLISRALGQALTTGSHEAYAAGISDDGAHVLYYSSANNVLAGVIDTNNGLDAFLFDRAGATTTLVSRSRNGGNQTIEMGLFVPPSLSADGSRVLFATAASDVIVGLADTNAVADLFLFDLNAAASTAVSRTMANPAITGNGISWDGRMSADGSRVAFASEADNLVAGMVDGNGIGGRDIFVFDRGSGATALVSKAAGQVSTSANQGAVLGAISADGSTIAYASHATDVVPGLVDANQRADTFLFDIATGNNQLASRALQSPTQTANEESQAVALNADGSLLIFRSAANNLLAGLIDDSEAADIYRFDRDTGRTLLISRAYGIANVTANEALYPIAFSADGQRILFDGYATNVVSSSYDRNFYSDVFVASVEGGILFSDDFE